MGPLQHLYNISKPKDQDMVRSQSLAFEKPKSIEDGQHFRNTMKLPCQYGKEEKLAFIRDLAEEINAEVNIPQ